MKHITLNNFRCFKDLRIDLTPGINLIIGDNASGKTSLLFGCKYAINCYFSGFSDLYTTWTTPGKNDFMRTFSGEKRLQTQPIVIKYSYYPSDNPSGEAFRLDNTELTLIKRNEKSRPLLSGLKELREYGQHLAQNQIVDIQHTKHQPDVLPLIASFSTHGIHMSRPKINAGYFIEYAQTPSFGYYMCHSTDGLLEHWIRRLLVLKEAGKNPVELKIVMDTLTRMFGEDGCDIIDYFDIRINLKDIVCKLRDGREIPVNILSDGYKRLVSIVLDLAFRCALLNSMKFEEEAALKTPGTVIIDEIDLHLHPSLQAKVLKALHKTFPALQFIVSTHAPMVMSGVENNKVNQVLHISYDEEKERYSVLPVDTFGMDLSTLAVAVLNVPSREPGVEKELRTLQETVDNENFADAARLLERMRHRFGDRLPELSGIETQIAIEELLK